MSYDAFDYIRHYWWDGSKGLNFKAAREAIAGLPDAEDGPWEDYGLEGRDDLLEQVDVLEEFVKNGNGNGAYIFSIGPVDVALVDTENDVGQAFSLLTNDELDPNLDIESALGLWDTPPFVKSATHAATL